MYDRYASSLLGIILNIIPDQRIAEEILQHSMLKIWNNIQQYRTEKSTLFTWMAAIAKNAAIDKARLKGFQYQKKTKTLENDVHYHKVVHHNALGIDVERLLGPLDEKYKIVLDYLYLKGYSQSEAAEALGIPLGTIKTRLRKAISILRDELKNEKKLFLGLLIIAGILLLI